MALFAATLTLALALCNASPTRQAEFLCGLTSSPCTAEVRFSPCPSDFSLYVHCTQGAQYVVKECPPGQVWDQQSVRCKTLDVDPVDLASYNPCVMGGARYHPHRSDPHKFIDCGNTATPVLKTCPQQLFWNQKMEYCDYPENLGLTTSIVYTTHPPIGAQTPGTGALSVYAQGFSAPCTRDHVQRNQMYWPYPGHPNYYILCDVNGNSNVMACLPDHAYSEYSHTCEPTQPSGITTPFSGITLLPIRTTQAPAGQTQGLAGSVYSSGFAAPCTADRIRNNQMYWPYPGYPNSHYYVQCDTNGNAYTMACPPAYVFSSMSHTCMPGQGLNPGVTTQPSYTLPTLQTNQPNIFTLPPLYTTKPPIYTLPPLFTTQPSVGGYHTTNYNAPCTRDALNRGELVWPLSGSFNMYVQCDLYGNSVLHSCQPGSVFSLQVHACVSGSPIG